MSGDFPGIREGDRDPMHFEFGEELQEPAEPEPPFWPKLLVVGVGLVAALVAIAWLANFNLSKPNEVQDHCYEECDQR